MTNEERWSSFMLDLREYVMKHHHRPDKHTSMLNQCKYTRKKIREGTLEEWKVAQFREIERMRDMEYFDFAQYKLITIRQNLITIMDSRFMIMGFFSK